MKHKIKMIVMDMDDTLLNDDRKISDYNKQVIFNAQKDGIKIVLASGRPEPAIKEFAEELKLKENYGFVISYNGAILTDCATGKEITSTKLTIKDISFIKEQALKYNLFLQTYINGEVVTDRDNKHTDFEGMLTGMPTRVETDLMETLNHEVVKIILMEDPTKLKAAEQKIRMDITDNVTMNISKPFFLEFTNIAVDKDKTIDVLCKTIGIKKDEVMAIGDSYNDLTMIKGCGLGIAMDNGPDDVKKHANHITHCNNSDGVATAINRYALAR